MLIASGSYKVNPPYNVSKKIFSCSESSCPDERYPQVKGNGGSGIMTDRKLSISGLLVLALAVSQLALL